MRRWLTPLLYTRLRLEMARARYERAELRIGGAFLVGVSVYVFTLCHWVLRTHFQCKAVLWRVCLYTPRTLAVLYPAMFIVPGIVSFRYSVYAALGVVWMVLCGGGTVVVAAVKGSKVVWLVSTTGFGASYVVLALLGRQYIAPVAPYSEYDQLARTNQDLSQFLETQFPPVAGSTTALDLAGLLPLALDGCGSREERPKQKGWKKGWD
ncbi:uncharacterized protein LOC9656830 [Selaginella moellendorffii]|uniref:uncharacterized protein LOC9656830 n=1 Tax=Selaginella moellendorffii TaxID=88036 RepID=UPI000D1C7459|nr:uncharacterized protein LOC9656830 [Selaginella moellendorffii]XP_024538435.1 uncharacterized protein LOC9656830 [Selaginella moellendorffii]|eukprot:XP_024538434.1 uncharacterized protein LOC9656830 [Selaginella moellendorffii]